MSADKTIYDCKCSDLQVKIITDDFRWGPNQDTLYLTEGMKGGGLKLNPELAEMTIVALQKYLKHKGHSVPLADSAKAIRKKCYDELTVVIEECETHDWWDENWDAFWSIYNSYDFEVEYCDPDMSCKDDMMALYNALKEEIGE